MAEDAEHVRQPHGREQQVKMEIVSMIHGGESPYDIIHHVAQWLEKSSGEPGYAQYVEDAMRAVYGCALMHVRPLEDERIRFAIDLHVKNIARLKACIERAKANGETAEIVKN